MGDFDALMNSLVEHVANYIGHGRVVSVVAFGDEAEGTAHIQIQLRNNTWPEQSHAIERMLELRVMFMDELSIDYIFVDEKSELDDSAPLPAHTFVA